MVMVMVISHIEPPFTQALLGFLQLSSCIKPQVWNHGFCAHGFACDMHKLWAWNHGFVHTVFYACCLYNLNMKRKYMKFEAYKSSLSGKPNIFYLRGARFKPSLHPSICTQMPLGLRLIFIFTSDYLLFVDPHFFFHWTCNIMTTLPYWLAHFIHNSQPKHLECL